MTEGARPEHADTIAAPPTPRSESSERAELAATQADSTGPSRPSGTDILARGAQIGRYLVLEPLGAGGMGAVYAAYDPELDRKVALKVLRAGSSDSGDTAGRARMLREAQAIARLSHPNVVAVHDVGPFGSQIFIAMELIDGATLTKWLTEANRSTREILEIFAQAGRGLAAAHRAGLIHRDFKPDNVLVGKDGRARVVDFGLVREAGAAHEKPTGRAPTEPAQRDTPSMLSVSLTQVGTVMGTPRYMAPEQFELMTADALSDQYSFCVALYEALNGTLPDRETPSLSASKEGAIAAKTSAQRNVPAHIRLAIRRGLKHDPTKRWPTMDALLAELSRDPGAQRRRWLVGLAAAAVVAGLAIGLVFAMRARQASDPCGGASEQLASVWSPAHRAAIERAFEATHLPYAAATFAALTKKLDAYSARWLQSYDDSCRATHVRHDQSDAMLDLRMACLAQKRAQLTGFVDALTHADSSVVATAITATVTLDRPDECDNRAALQDSMRHPSDPATVREINALSQELVRIQVMFYAGDIKKTEAPLVALRERTRALGYRPLEASVAYSLGQTRIRLGNLEGGRRDFLEAFTTALEGHHDYGATMCAIGLLGLSAQTAQLANGKDWSLIAAAMIERAGGAPELEAALFGEQGSLATMTGKYAEAAALHERARALRERTVPGSLELATTYASLSYDYDQIGRYAEARAMGEKSLAIETVELGADHPHVAIVLDNLGNIAADEGDLDAARGYYLRVLAIREKGATAGDDPANLANIVHNLGELAVTRGRDDEALPYFKRAIDLREHIDADDPEITLPMVSLGNVYRRRTACTEALPLFEKALDIVERKLTREHPYASDALIGIGACMREAGKLEPSQTALERALAIRRGDARPVELAEAEVELARTLAARGAKQKAHELAAEARALYAADPASKAALADLDVWLRSH
jgi:tetratricopeptide (TPR) repeat protein